MKHLTDEEIKHQFESSVDYLAEVFPVLREYLQRQLRADVFIVDDENFKVLKIKHEYLDEVLNTLLNCKARK